VSNGFVTLFLCIFLGMNRDDRYTRITLRMPKDLHERLASLAEETSKSMNAEIIGRLEASVFSSELPEVLIPAAKARQIAAAARQRLSAVIESRTISAINRAIANGKTMAVVEFNDLQLDAMGDAEVNEVYGNLFDKLDAAGYYAESDGEETLVVFLSRPPAAQERDQ